MAKQVEPWLRGTHPELSPVQRGVVHALELAREDVVRWCEPLTVEELESRPFGLPSVAFHIRHIARSLDRLATYAEGRGLTEMQLASLQDERVPRSDKKILLREFQLSLQQTLARVLAFDPAEMDAHRWVGRDRLPTTMAGLIVHIADHTQRHTGQAVTTAKVVLALRDSEQS